MRRKQVRGTTHIRRISDALIGGRNRPCFNAAIRTPLQAQALGVSTRKGFLEEKVHAARFHQMRALCELSFFKGLRHRFYLIIIALFFEFVNDFAKKVLSFPIKHCCSYNKNYSYSKNKPKMTNCDKKTYTENSRTEEFSERLLKVRKEYSNVFRE